ncbi:MAG: flavin reductase family protein [Planctomycetota bacterium]|jgi:flavin reductase (DIM6/NTAB) family NADH-FMN oxidoreductase RutF
MKVDFRELDPKDRYGWMSTSIVPRPIAFVSTVSKAGVTNVAPFSFFSGLGSNPPYVVVSVGRKAGGVKKDTYRNAEETGELVVNVVSEELAEKMVQAAGNYPPDRSEFDACGLTAVPSDLVKPPRVGESPVALECRVVRLESVEEGKPETLIVAEILCAHAKDEMLTDGLPDPKKVKPLARLGGDLYAPLGDLIRIARPK